MALPWSPFQGGVSTITANGLPAPADKGNLPVLDPGYFTVTPPNKTGGMNDCVCCTGTTHEDALTQIHQHVQDHDFHVVGVLGPKPWSYTVGLANSGLPELVVTEYHPGQAHQLINAVGYALIEGCLLHDVVALADVQPGPIHVDHLRGDLVNMWREYYGYFLNGAFPDSVEFIQLKLGASHVGFEEGKSQTDLSKPPASLYRHPARAQRRRRPFHRDAA